MTETGSGLAGRRADHGSGRGHWLSRTGRLASQPVPAFADGIIYVFLLCLGVVATWRVYHRSTSDGEVLAGCGYLVALIALQMWLFAQHERRPQPPVLGIVLLAQAAAVYLPFLHFPWWLGLPGILAGSLLLAMPMRLAVPLFVAVVASIGAYGAATAEGGAAAPGGPVFAAVFDAVTTVMTGLSVYGLTRLARLVHELHRARGELAQLAVADERLRFARDLQDLLGIRLSGIVARTERIRGAPVRRRTEHVQHELAEVLDISRNALAEVRSVARGYGRLSLEDELAGAGAVLAAADVAVQVRHGGGELTEPVNTILAVVLREAVTNVLRRGRATRCEVALWVDESGARLEVSDDAGDGAAEGVASVGRQIRGLGGTLSAGAQPDGMYRLVASVPLEEPALGSPATKARALPAVSRRLSNSVVVAVLLCFGTIILADVLIGQRDWAQAGLGVVCLVVVLGMQAGYFMQPVSIGRTNLNLAALALQACFVYVPVVAYGGLWLTMPGFLAANALLVLRPPLSVPLTVGVLTTVGWIYGQGNVLVVDIVGEIFWASTTVTVVYGLTRLARLVGELNQARAELARLAVAQERLRFARDVHDLLGLSLSAVTLKAELANRLLGAHPDRVDEQLSEIVSLSRKAIGDVRSVASGYQEFRLDEELRLARSVLVSADIDVRIDADDIDIPEPQATVLATVAREGVTNVLRHSKAEHCAITVRPGEQTVQLEIVNNGLTRERPDHGDGGGNGIANLSHRIGQVGGTLAAGVHPDGTYRLRAAVPLAG